MTATPAMDTVMLRIVSFLNDTLSVCMQSEDCYECDLICESKHELIGRTNTSILLKNIDTKYGTNVTLVDTSNKNQIWSCIFDSTKQRGSYLLNVTNNSFLGDNCPSLKIIEHAQNPYMAILWAFVIYFGLAIVWGVGHVIYRYRCQTCELERALITDLGSPDEPTSVYHLSRSEESIPMSHNPQNKRLRSLDVFRGICIVLMMFVEYGGGKYRIFEHSRWNGLTFADLVFPWFMWIMGVSSALSIHLLLRKAVPKRKIFLKILKRSVILFMLGLVLNTKKGCDFDNFRIMGVLQRFAITYFIVSTMELVITHVPDPNQVSSSRWEVLKDLRFSWIQWLLMGCFVVVHESLTFALNVPDCPKGYLGPGGCYNHSSHSNCTGGAAGYIDRQVFGLNHLYTTPTFKKIYKTELNYDPEGILGTLTATFMVFLGLQAGKILIVFVNNRGRVARWLVWAVVLGVIGTILCKGQQNDGWIPVNKNLWSLSFVLVLAALANIMLALCYVLVDMKSCWSGSPFLYPGMNAIVLYIGLEFTKCVFPFGWLGCKDHACHLAVSLWGTTLWVLISVYMHYKKVFVSI